MSQPEQYDVIGVMSGTSLDGLDIAWCRFTVLNGKYNFQIQKAKTIEYQSDIRGKLKTAHLLGGYELQVLHNEFGRFIGDHVKDFISENSISPCCIASHGHTVFHNPSIKLTLQIGNGASVAAITGIDTVCDFRTADVMLGGQGAPLVPFGDIHLFSEYDAALNLGGFSNITMIQHQPAVAFDICPVNIVLNLLSLRDGYKYDDKGERAKNGQIINELLEKLEKHPRYQNNDQSSLSREWVERFLHPLIADKQIEPRDYLRTFIEHIALRVSEVLKRFHVRSCLCTGGGTFNDYLLSRIRNYSAAELIVPDSLIVQYKEALIFAFLGLKRLQGDVNIYGEITGARKNSSSGIIWKGK